MNKSTFRASSDVALIKYWGKRDPILRLPENGSISMILQGLETTTTVEFQTDISQDIVTIQGSSNPIETARVIQHLERIRKRFRIAAYARIQSTNNFPKGTGLSSSGSGFAALTYAIMDALCIDISEKDLSILARLASGTACRCVCGGFVEWKGGSSSDTSYSETIFPADYWDLRDVVVIVNEGMKNVSSTQGHKSARTSPFFPIRQKHINAKLEAVKRCLKNRDFSCLGEIVEAEALEFHSVLLTSQPPLIAWHPGTIEIMQYVQELRQQNIEAYFTINTGFNIHVLTLPLYEKEVRERLINLPSTKKIIMAKVGEKPWKAQHLF